MKKNIIFPVRDYSFDDLCVGDEVTISGCLYVARDAAHKKLIEAIEGNEVLPIPIENNLIYYMGPSPAPEGTVIGSCGPTTSIRMDAYTVALLEKGLKATMGKGVRGDAMAVACKKYGAIYLVTYGGCGAYLRQFVTKMEVVAYPDLGPEAIFKLNIENFPAIVGIDTKGNNLYNT
ncbi:FumA C-terminus/TtdB family hydratase beta subunit [bacterium]|nr:FumA C-terminus/TtdB family hydratase beta subunit [bacterium]